jgi:hypothetical protein
VWVGHPYFGFGFGINIGFWRPFGWGWPAWGLNWGARRVYYNRAPWIGHGPAFFDHRAYAPPVYRAGAGRYAAPGYHGAPAEAYHGAPAYHAPAYAAHPVEPPVNRGFGSPEAEHGMRSGAFSGYAHGGVTQGYAARGMSSMGGFHGGGGHAGGGRGR